MRIYGPNGTALARAPAAARRSAAGTFTVSEQETPRNTAAAGSLARGIDARRSDRLARGRGSAERKKRGGRPRPQGARRARQLKLALLDGSVDRSTLARLKVAAEGLTEETGDPGLDSVLGEIELRVAVELAKAGIR